MNRMIFRSLLVAAVVVLGANCVWAQDQSGSMSFSEEEVAKPAETPPAEEKPAASAEGDGATQSDLMSALGEDDATVSAGTKKTDATSATAAAQTQGHPIWAVQQVYALRKGRVDLQPSFGVSLNDPYVQHQSINLGLSYYITEVLAAGVSFNFYRWLQAETDLNYSVKRATHQTVPINEYFWGGQLNFTYVPMYGKFAFFKEWILHWDVWVIGGGGFIFTRPTAVIDPEYRTFDFADGMKFSFNVGLGGRMYLTRFLAIYLELRDYIFPEEIESLQTYSSDQERADSSNWVDDDLKLTNNVTLHAGVSLFIPFTFEYKMQK